MIKKKNNDDELKIIFLYDKIIFLYDKILVLKLPTESLANETF